MLGLGLSLPALAVRRPSGEAAFTPASLFAAGEQGLWYDPSDLSTMFTDTAGTTPVTTAGQAVALLLDKSGRGNHATQSITAARPILRQTAGGLWYLEFDGIDDWLVTGTITPGTDKAQVFAGIYRPTDTAGVILEHSANWNTNAGSFGVFTGTSPTTSTGPGFQTASRGTLFSAGMFAVKTGFPPPTTVVLSSTYDISNDLSTIRLNGSDGTNAVADKGTGNFLAYPLYIGRRSGIALAFNGHIYSLITRFGPNLNTSAIEQAEAWIAARTGVTL